MKQKQTVFFLYIYCYNINERYTKACKPKIMLQTTFKKSVWAYQQIILFLYRLNIKQVLFVLKKMLLFAMYWNIDVKNVLSTHCCKISFLYRATNIKDMIYILHFFFIFQILFLTFIAEVIFFVFCKNLNLKLKSIMALYTKKHFCWWR